MDKTEDIPLIAATLVFASVLLLFAAVFQYVRSKREHYKMIQKIRSGEQSHLGEPMEHSHRPADSEEPPVLKFFGAVGERVQPEKEETLRRRNLEMLRAGFRKPNALPVFWGVKCVLAMLFAAIFLTSQPWLASHLLPTQMLLYTLTCVALGFYLPDIWLSLRISRRKRSIQDGLPDALDLLVVCVEAGMSLDAAIYRVGEEIKLENKDLSDELMLMNLEVRAGKLRRDALKNLALRTDVEDIRNLTALLIQADRFGTGIAGALRVYSDAFRTKRRQRAEEIAAKLPVKLIIPLALFILPSILVVAVGPAAIQILRVFIQR